MLYEWYLYGHLISIHNCDQSSSNHMEWSFAKSISLNSKQNRNYSIDIHLDLEKYIHVFRQGAFLLDFDVLSLPLLNIYCSNYWIWITFRYLRTSSSLTCLLSKCHCFSSISRHKISRIRSIGSTYLVEWFFSLS